MNFKRKSFRRLTAFSVTIALILNSALSFAHEGKNSASLAELVRSFSHNTIPNLRDPLQLKAFQFYIKQSFQGQVEFASEPNFQSLLALEAKFDPNGKYLFGGVEIQSTKSTYPVSAELKRFVSDLIKGMGTLKALFLQPVANLGAWSKLKADGVNFMNQDRLDLLMDEVVPNLQNIDFNSVLIAYMKFFLKAELSADIRASFIESLIHMFALMDPLIQEGLRSDRGEDVIEALKAYLDLRLDLQRRFGDPSEKALQRPVVKVPLLSKEKFTNQISRLESAMLDGESRTLSEIQWVRPLSMMEAPFRSCLAGSDCSSRTYFDRALDPAFYYFTLTDSSQKSKGHVTIVLGDAVDNGKTIPIALVDKIQDIEASQVPLLLEAVRQSVEKQGYTLVVSSPFNRGANGISNYEQIRIAVAKMLPYAQQTRLLTHHQTRASANDFSTGYSTVFDVKEVKPLLPLQLSNVRDARGPLIRMLLREPLPQSRLKQSPSIDQILSEIDRLRFGGEEDRLIFLDLQEVLLGIKFINDKKGFIAILRQWVADQGLSLKLRNRALKSLLQIEPWALPEIWPSMQPSEIQNLLLTWSETKRIELNKEGLYYAALTAIPFLRVSDDFLFKILDQRVYWLNATATRALVESAKDPRVQLLLKSLTGLHSEVLPPKTFIDFTVAIILYEALAEAERNGRTDVAESLREPSTRTMNQAFSQFYRLDKKGIKALASRIGPFLNRPDTTKTFLNTVQEMIDNLRPLINNRRIGIVANLIQGIFFFAIFMGINLDISLLEQENASPIFTNSKAFWGTLAVGAMAYVFGKWHSKTTTSADILEAARFKKLNLLVREAQRENQRRPLCEKILERKNQGI